MWRAHTSPSRAHAQATPSPAASAARTARPPCAPRCRAARRAPGRRATASSASALSRASSSSSAGGALIGVFDAEARRRGDPFQRGIAQRDGEREVAWPQRAGMRHEGIAGGAVDDVGEEHGEPALPIPRGEVGEGSRVVGLDQSRPRSSRAHREPARSARRPRAGGMKRITCRQRRGGRCCRRAGTALCANSSAASIAASSRGRPSLSAVSRRPASIIISHLLATFVLVAPHHQLAAPRRRLPVDRAGLLARYPFVQALEHTPFAEPADGACPLRGGAAPASGRARMRRHAADWVDRDCPRQRRAACARRGPSGRARGGAASAGELPRRVARV